MSVFDAPVGMHHAPSLHGGTRRDEGSGHADVHSLLEVYVVSLKQSQAVAEV